MQWECYCCQEKQVNAPFFQVDVVEGDKILLSNYYQQRFVKYTGKAPPLNAAYCLKCVDQMPGLQNNFEKENTKDYLFEMNGYTCRSKEKEEAFSRDCGHCIGCQTQLTLNSVFSQNNKYFFILWSPHLLSRCFPSPGVPQVWKLRNPSKFYIQSDKPLYLCVDCLKTESWRSCPGTIVCPLCEKNFNRWIFHSETDPVKEGRGCYCHVYKDEDDGTEVVMDGYIDPISYEWIGEKPEKFDNNKPFCSDCLRKLVKDGLLKDNYESCSSESDYEPRTISPEERERIKKVIFPDLK